MTTTNATDPTSHRHDLVVIADCKGVTLVSANGKRIRPLLRLPVMKTGSPQTLGRVLVRFVETQKPRRVLLSVRHHTRYETVVDPTVTALETSTKELGIPFVWIPDVLELSVAAAFLGSTKRRATSLLDRVRDATRRLSRPRSHLPRL